MIRQRIDRRRFPDSEKLAIARQLRRDATPGERYAWSLLRGRGILGLKFRRQHVLRGFIVDFYCPELRLVLELDGASHDHPDRADYDVARATFLAACGYRVLRARANDVTREGLERILAPFAPRNRSSTSSPLSRTGK